LKSELSIPFSSQRVSVLDLTRVLAMILMVQGHTIDALANPDSFDITQSPWSIWNIMRGFTAPIFLIVSGAVQVFANKRNEDGKLKSETSKKRLTMALVLILIGYVLMYPTNTIYDLIYLDTNQWHNILKVNILQLIGISLLMILGLFHLTKTDKSLGISAFILALIFTLATPIVHSLDFKSIHFFFADYFTPKFGSIFPIFPFSAYFFWGITFGVIIKSVDSNLRTKFLLKYGVPTGVVFLLMALPYAKSYNDIIEFFSTFPSSGSGLIFLRISIVCFLFSFMALIYPLTRKVEPIYRVFGKRSLLVYVIHLNLIYGNQLLKGFEYYSKQTWSGVYIFASVVFVEVLSFLLAYLIDHSLTHYYIKARKSYTIALTIFFLVIFFLRG
jgi:uncharacterized membrane protein